MSSSETLLNLAGKESKAGRRKGFAGVYPRSER